MVRYLETCTAYRPQVQVDSQSRFFDKACSSKSSKTLIFLIYPNCNPFVRAKFAHIILRLTHWSREISYGVIEHAVTIG